MPGAFACRVHVNTWMIRRIIAHPHATHAARRLSRSIYIYRAPVYLRAREVGTVEEAAGGPALGHRQTTAARARQHCRVAASVAARGRISRMRTRQRLRALAAHLAPARSGPADGHSEEESLSLPLSFPPPPSLSHTAASTEEIYRAPMTPASLGGALQPLRDSSALLDDTAALRFAHFVSATHSPIQT